MEQQYLDLLQKVLVEGELRPTRQGGEVLGIFGAQMRFDLTKGFPLLTTKKMPFRIIFEELRWFLSGSSNLKDLLDQNVNIWNGDAYRHYMKNLKSLEDSLTEEQFLHKASQEGFDLGPIYGHQWRKWTDQIFSVIRSLDKDPYGRRHIVSAWNPPELSQMALPPCHVLFQFYAHTDGRLDCHLYQRSADMFLGVPFNIASYSLLLHMIAYMTQRKPGTFVHTVGDAHIYSDHIQQSLIQIKREPIEPPTLRIDTKERLIQDPHDFVFEDMILEGYKSHSILKGNVST